jgi:sugar/nucleoside kinase (ribokinase family)
MSATLCVGEALIDFVAETKNGDVGASDTFHRAAGGAVANVAVGIARLGGTAHFAGTISRDAFGRFLLRTLAREGVDVSGVRAVDEHTTLAFVARTDDGDRGFEFFRDPGADSRLVSGDVSTAAIESSAIVHFGGVLLSSEPARSACIAVTAAARAAGKLVSFDPNARPSLFASATALKRSLLQGCAAAHLVKLSEEDLDALGMQLAQAPQLLGETTRAVIVSRGARGCMWWCDGRQGSVRAPEVTVVDTTGAGDAMTAAVLLSLGTHHGARVTAETVADAARAGCAAGAVAVQRVGAIPSLPTQSELREMLSRVP